MAFFSQLWSRSGDPHRRAHACAALLGALAFALPRAAAAQTPAPAWVGRFVAAERGSAHFAHAWIRKPTAPAGAPSAMAIVAQGTAYQLRGTFRMAVLPATWSDVTPAIATAALDSLFFSPSGVSSGYSLNQYYREASGGRFAIAGQVTPWLRLPHPRAYYGMAIAPYVHDALQLADASTDWRQYDNDGPDGIPNSGDDDGFVDLVTVVHPLADGVCSANSGPVATGWRVSLSGAFNGKPFTTHSVGANGQPLKVEDFVVTAALNCNGTGLAPVNIPAHEMGHALGLPDLYDLDQSSYGVGQWDVMGYGVYLGDGHPGLMSAWTKNQLGWLDVTQVTSDGTITLPAAETGGAAYRIDLPNSTDYLLLENRQRLGADAGLPGSGLLVWRIDSDALSRTLPVYRANDDDNRPGVLLLQGDGANNLKNRVNMGDAGDPLPGTSARTTIGDNTAPSIRTHTGAPSGVSLLDIGVQNGSVTVTVRFSGEPPRARVMAELLRGHSLTAVETTRLDSLGNHDGAFDVGDVAAYLKRTGW